MPSDKSVNNQTEVIILDIIRYVNRVRIQGPLPEMETDSQATIEVLKSLRSRVCGLGEGGAGSENNTACDGLAAFFHVE